MRAWLQGDLRGVDPRAELELLRNALRDWLAAGEDLDRFWRALAEVDEVACAELVTGARALPEVVSTVYPILDVLERLLTPAGLYRRLVELDPAEGEPLLHRAARQHPGSQWIARLSRRVDPTPGRLHLLAAHEVDALEAAARVCAEEGQSEGLIAVASELATLTPAAALVRADYPQAAAAAAAAALDVDASLPVLPVLAAVWGPELDPLAAVVARAITHPEARRALRASGAGLLRTLEILDERED